MVNIPKSRSEYRGGTAKLSPPLYSDLSSENQNKPHEKKEAFAAIAEFVYDSSRAGYYTLSGGVKMSTKFLFPDWENEDDDSQDLCGRMREMAEEAARRERQGLPEKKEPEPPAPTAKSPRKRANFFSDLVEQIAKAKILLFTEDGEPFAYDEELGCYQPLPQLTAWLANFFPEITTRSLLANDLREIAQRLTWREDLRCCRDTLNRSKELVNLENGVFNLETGELMPHNPRFRFTYQVNASYLQDPEYINCPTFEAFCRSSLDGDTQKRQLLLEIIGYICSDLTVGKCAFFLQGQPNSGKSIVAEFVGRLFDPSLVSNVPLHQLGDRFSRAELAGKKVNIAGEIAGRALRDISLFKSVTGSDRIMGELKGRDPFYFTPQCKLLFAGNTLPRTTEADTTAAFANRLVILLFNQSIPPEKQDKSLLDRLWKEADSIVTLSLHALQNLMDRNFVFTQPEDSKSFLELFTNRSNVLSGFLGECCTLSPKARVFNVDLFAAFVDYCARNGLEAISRSHFFDLLSGIPGVYAKCVRIGKENRQGHEGIALKESEFSGTLEQPSQSTGRERLSRSNGSGTNIIPTDGEEYDGQQEKN